MSAVDVTDAHRQKVLPLTSRRRRRRSQFRCLSKEQQMAVSFFSDSAVKSELTDNFGNPPPPANRASRKNRVERKSEKLLARCCHLSSLCGAKWRMKNRVGKRASRGSTKGKKKKRKRGISLVPLPSLFRSVGRLRDFDVIATRSREYHHTSSKNVWNRFPFQDGWAAGRRLHAVVWITHTNNIGNNDSAHLLF